jgi:hypothetical protein
MLYCLLDGRARTATELAVGGRLSARRRPASICSGCERRTWCRLSRRESIAITASKGPTVAAALEALSVLAGGVRTAFKPTAPDHLRRARTCYDHIAGAVGVALHDRFVALQWLVPVPIPAMVTIWRRLARRVSTALGIEVAACRESRRRFRLLAASTGASDARISADPSAPPFSSRRLRRRWLTRSWTAGALTVTATGSESCKALGVDVA